MDINEKDNPMVKQIEGEPDHEYPHIVRVSGKLHCNNCGDWEWLKYWVDFIKSHCNCRV